MKRDMDLAREILLEVERHDGDPWDLPTSFTMAGDAARLAYHAMLLHQAGFIHAVDYSGGETLDWRPVYLTWDGHEFLDTIRDKAIWEKTKQGAAAAGGFSVDLLKDLARGFLKKQVEDFTGVKLP
jgi:hypothetical protein